MRIHSIIKESIVDGPGLRTVIFFQGCGHGCPGCHNPETHSFDGGVEYSIGQIIDIIHSDKLSTGVTFSGGDPMYQIISEKNGHMMELLAAMIVRQGLNLGMYTGFTLEQLQTLCEKHEAGAVGLCDWIVTEPFMESLKSSECAFRGSTNQRIYHPSIVSANWKNSSNNKRAPMPGCMSECFTIEFNDITELWDAKRG